VRFSQWVQVNLMTPSNPCSVKLNSSCIGLSLLK
jgi:hypothetical protein